MMLLSDYIENYDLGNENFQFKIPLRMSSVDMRGHALSDRLLMTD